MRSLLLLAGAALVLQSIVALAAAPPPQPIGHAVQVSQALPPKLASTLDCLRADTNPPISPRPLRIVAREIRIPDDLVAGQPDSLNLGYQWLDAERVIVQRPVHLTGPVQLIITAKQVEFEKGAYFSLASKVTPSTLNPLMVTPQCVLPPKGFETGVIVATEHLISRSANAGVFRSPALSNEPTRYWLRSTTRSCADKPCERVMLGGLRSDATRTTVEEFAAREFLDPLLAMSQWPDLTYAHLQFDFANQPYDAKTQETVTEGLQGLLSLSPGQLRTSLRLRVEDTLGLLRSGRNAFGQDAYYLPRLKYEELEKYLTELDIKGQLTEIERVNDEVTYLQGAIAGKAIEDAFLSHQRGQAVRDEAALKVQLAAAETQFEKVSQEMTAYADAFTQAETRYNIALQHEQWRQETLQRKAKKRKQIAGALTTVAVVAAGASTGGSGATTAATIATYAQPAAALYAAYADAKTSKELCGKTKSFLESAGYAIAQHEAIEQQGQELSKQFRSTMAGLKTSVKDMGCYARHKGKDDFQACFVRDEARQKQFAEGALALPGEYSAKSRLNGALSSAKEAKAQLDVLDGLQVQNPISVPECAADRPIPPAVASAYTEYLRTQAELEQANVRIQEAANKANLANTALLSNAELQASLNSIQPNTVGLGPDAQIVLDSSIAKRRALLLWLGHAIEMHRRWSFMLSQGQNQDRIQSAAQQAINDLVVLATNTSAIEPKEISDLAPTLTIYQSETVRKKLLSEFRQEQVFDLTRENFVGDWEAFARWYQRVQLRETDEAYYAEFAPPPQRGQLTFYTVASTQVRAQLRARPNGLRKLDVETFVFPYGDAPNASDTLQYCLGDQESVANSSGFTPHSRCGYPIPADQRVRGMYLISEGAVRLEANPETGQKGTYALTPWGGPIKVVFYPQAAVGQLEVTSQADAPALLLEDLEIRAYVSY